MAYKPFSAECSNIYNEINYNTIPSPFGFSNGGATQAQKRSVVDTLSTTVFNPNSPVQNPWLGNYQAPPQILYAQKEYFPWGLSFTFNPTIPNPNVNQIFNPVQQQQPKPQGQMMHQQPLMAQQQTALQQLQKGGLERMLLEEHLNKAPYRLRFHQNEGTSTTDLLKGPSQVPLLQRIPDIKNLLETLCDLKNEVECLGIISTTPPERLYPGVHKAKGFMLNEHKNNADVKLENSRTQLTTERPNSLNMKKLELSSIIRNNDAKKGSFKSTLEAKEESVSRDKNEKPELCKKKRHVRFNGEASSKPSSSKKKRRPKKRSRTSESESESYSDTDSDY